MCRKVKDVKKEEINRLLEKYAHVIDGKIEFNIHKISNFKNLVIPTLAQQFKEQSVLVRYFCLFSNCIPHKKSYSTRQKYVQHLCLKHAHQLPGQGLFLLNNDHNIQFGGFRCEKCNRLFRRKDHLQSHISNVCTKEKKSRKFKKNNVVENDNELNETILLDESFGSCRLIDISLDESSVICLDD
ncbi:unnamed protein product [Brachionus calyciflorus]|uniref:C2H2-type domain-containing protein n=1 Tax=Brachionus calyciflorus TaxID=104777 RepID=A0A814JCN3_9BILA|nr:unnamed protein product [Brachionus calyciflorus]